MFLTQEPSAVAAFDSNVSGHEYQLTAGSEHALAASKGSLLMIQPWSKRMKMTR
jgi:hypothetical protein